MGSGSVGNMNIIQDSSEFAVIKPFEYKDEETGDRVCISISPYYSKLTINNKDYFFVRETGVFDGTATNLESDGPILID